MSKNSKSSVVCIISGARLGVRPEIYAKRVEKYGSDGELARCYVSREAKQMLRDGKTVDEIRAEFEVTNLPPVPQDVMDRLTAELSNKKSKSTGSKNTKASNKKSKAQVEREVEESTNVDEDVSEFLNSGAQSMATA